MKGCPDCDRLTGGDCGRHFGGTSPTPGPGLMGGFGLFQTERGWQCPVCHRVNNPRVEFCQGPHPALDYVPRA